LDTPYPFSIDDLIDKMKEEYSVDIIDSRICHSVSREVYEEYGNLPLYVVYLWGVPVKSRVVGYLIDGNTGETLFTATRNIREQSEPLVVEYFNSLKK
jgi:hypothetical protein